LRWYRPGAAGVNRPLGGWEEVALQYQGIFTVTIDSAWSCRWPEPWSCGASLPGVFAGSWIASRRHFFSIGRDALLDCGANRWFVIPLELRVVLDLDPPFDAVLVGLGDSVEIWPEANYHVSRRLAAGRASDDPDQKKMRLAGLIERRRQRTEFHSGSTRVPSAKRN
jgi:hypothetical protein